MKLRRYYKADQLRTEGGEDNEPLHLRGHASVFNTPSVDLGGFQEIVLPGSFKKSIGRDDIRALWEHESKYVLGRNIKDTLFLEEDDRGLSVDILPPPTYWADGLVVSIKRGDIDQMSFGFSLPQGGERWEKDGDKNFRYISEAKLYDVSPVTFAAYPATDVDVRSICEVVGLDSLRLLTCLVRSEKGLGLESDDLEIIKGFAGRLVALIDKESRAVSQGSNDPEGDESAQGRKLSDFQRRLRAAEASLTN